MAVGICQLCGQKGEIVSSHVWPAFAYKRYVSDLSKGGQFLDLQTGKPNAQKQYTRPWFCERCDRDVLGKNEKYAAEFCDKLEKTPADVHSYDGCLLRFAVSISWRTVKSWGEVQRRSGDKMAGKASHRWKDYLRGKERHLGPYTQHLFIVFDRDASMHKGIGGGVFTAERLVLSQIGPLFIIGLLDRSHLSVADLDIWSHSKLLAEGGTIKPISAWRVGTELTLDCARFLARHDGAVKRRLFDMALTRSKNESPFDSPLRG
jgi:hypothetical protein